MQLKDRSTSILIIYTIAAGRMPRQRVKSIAQLSSTANVISMQCDLPMSSIR